MSFNGIRFLYLNVLGWPEVDLKVALPKRKQRIPEWLSRAEVARLLAAVDNRKHRMMLTTCYGCGLRVSELVALRVSDIDGERHLLRVTLGKGGKDRQVLLSGSLLQLLRRYWRIFHPTIVLFYGRDPLSTLSITTAQKVFQAAKQRAGIDKIGGIHSLRHAYATHQLAAGMPLHQLKELREGKLPNPDVDYPDLGEPAAYACSNRICSFPGFSAEELQANVAQMAKLKPARAAQN